MLRRVTKENQVEPIDIIYFNKNDIKGTEKVKIKFNQELKQLDQIKEEIIGIEKVQNNIIFYDFHKQNVTYKLYHNLTPIILTEFLGGYYGVQQVCFIFLYSQMQIYDQYLEPYNKDIIYDFYIENLQIITQKEALSLQNSFISKYNTFLQYSQINNLFKFQIKKSQTIQQNLQYTPFQIQNPEKYTFIGLNYKHKKYTTCYAKKDITCYGQNYYPVKMYTYIQKIEPNQLLIQNIENNTISIYIYDNNTLISIDKFYKLSKTDSVFYQINQKMYTFKVQMQYSNLETLNKKIKTLEYYNLIQVRGNTTKYFGISIQFPSLVQDTPIVDLYKRRPEVLINILNNTNVINIEVFAEDIFTIFFNLTYLQNFLQLQHDYQLQTKKQQYQQLTQNIHQVINIKSLQYYVEKGMKNIDFQPEAQIFNLQLSSLSELFVIDPIGFGEDERYDYDKQVNSVEKYPVIFYQESIHEPATMELLHPLQNIFIKDILVQTNLEPYTTLLVYDEEAEDGQVVYGSDDGSDDGSDSEVKGGQSPQSGQNPQSGQSPSGGTQNGQTPDRAYKGGKKGSPVYYNFITSDIDDFIYYQNFFMIYGFWILNQTYENKIRFKCGQKYPYLNATQTKNKDQISCRKEPIEAQGVFFYQFFQSCRRILDYDRYKDFIYYLRNQLIGRVSLSATKFSRYISPGRVSELSIDLKKKFGNYLMLGIIPKLGKFENTFEYTKEFDFVWFYSVFNFEMQDVQYYIYYDVDNDKYYYKYVSSKTNINLVFLVFGDVQYILIKNQLKIERQNNKKYYYYIPVQIEIQEKKKINNKYSQQWWAKQKAIDKGTIFIQGNYSWIDTNIGFLPCKHCNIQTETDKFNNLPKYSKIKQYIEDEQHYIINENEMIIGCYTGDNVYFYFQEENPDLFSSYNLVIGVYPQKLIRSSKKKIKDSIFVYQKALDLFISQIQQQMSKKKDKLMFLKHTLQKSTISTDFKEYIKKKIYSKQDPIQYVLNYRPINPLFVQNDYYEKFVIKDKQTAIYLD